MSEQSFADLGVSAPVVRALKTGGIESPFPIQRLVIADVLAGVDVLAKSPTGSGKTLAFGVPLVDRLNSNGGRPTALILAPTRELVRQIQEELVPLARARALRVATVYGGVGIHKQSHDAARAHIIVATPGRLEDLLARKAFSLKKIELLVLDEADRMLDMGFRPAVDRIVNACPADRQTLFFSATLDGDVGKLARAYTRNPRKIEHTPELNQAVVTEHRFKVVKHDNRLAELITELRAPRELALVFVRTKRGADRLVKRLALEGIRAVAMHGDKSQRNREKALAQFEAGRVDTLVATDVAARGIDVAGISHVINFDPPEDRDSYVHRVGRTGRAGRSGMGITFFADQQTPDMRRLAGALGLQREFIRAAGPGGRVAGNGSRQPKAAQSATARSHRRRTRSSRWNRQAAR